MALQCEKDLLRLLRSSVNANTSNNGNPTPQLAPVDIIAALHAALATHAGEYYDAHCHAFLSYVTKLQEFGFTAVKQEKCSFAMPQRDGTLTEFFPNGAAVEVTAANYSYFLRLYWKWQQEIIPDVQDFPIAPLLHLGGNYYPIAILIVDYLTNINSDWCIRNENDWNALQVTYCIPFAGELHDIRPGTRNDPVPFSKARRFGLDAKKSLQQLMDAAHNSAWSSTLSEEESQQQQQLSLLSHGYLDFLRSLDSVNKPMGISMTEEEFNNLNLTYSIPLNNTFVPLISDNDNEPVKLEDKDRFIALARSKIMESINVETRSSNNISSCCSHLKEMPSLEESFWNVIESIRKDPTSGPGLCFSIRILDRDVLLKEDGANIAVTKENVEEYVNLIYKMRDMIHAAFVEDEVKNSHHSFSTISSLNSSEAKRRSLEQYPPHNSAEWNNFTLDPDDLKNEVFQILQNIQLNKNMMKPEDYGGPFLTFVIPTYGKGLYKLLPNGNSIPVTWSNHEEFLERLEFEKQRLEGILLAQRLYTSKRKQQKQQSTNSGSFVKMLPGDWSLPVCQRSSTLPLQKETNQNKSEHKKLLNHPPPETMNAAAITTLDEIDMYEKNLRTLQNGKDKISLKVFEDFGLRYVLTVGGEKIELVKGGKRRLVCVQDLDTYVNLAVDKLSEIRRCILSQVQRNDSEVHVS
ncbi:uncharacterized protein TM35_000016220 [Trypanosoma theileri]|uniref:Uncharacterized protein n=1 Tax=Trypanosoma theileri TaxID=67003 RepID=A0A1X0PA97_9TRYP|nr:uncharacterized protein TM35_000016220 [Trypanosoma theileri]ORC93745.1 hypothetical protein TM35_000016220 [Trypanosoma theileri]